MSGLDDYDSMMSGENPGGEETGNHGGGSKAKRSKTPVVVGLVLALVVALIVGVLLYREKAKDDVLSQRVGEIKDEIADVRKELVELSERQKKFEEESTAQDERLASLARDIERDSLGRDEDLQKDVSKNEAKVLKLEEENRELKKRLDASEQRLEEMELALKRIAGAVENAADKDSVDAVSKSLEQSIAEIRKRQKRTEYKIRKRERSIKEIRDEISRSKEERSGGKHGGKEGEDAEWKSGNPGLSR